MGFEGMREKVVGGMCAMISSMFLGGLEIECMGIDRGTRFQQLTIRSVFFLITLFTFSVFSLRTCSFRMVNSRIRKISGFFRKAL